MHPDLVSALAALGLDGQVPQLETAARHSQETIDRARAYLTGKLPMEQAQNLDVVLHGSFARREASGESDFDYLVVVHALPDQDDVGVMRRMLRAVDCFVIEQLTAGGQAGDRRPGATGIFGRIASAPDLTERIGLEQDTNISHTRRLLIIEARRASPSTSRNCATSSSGRSWPGTSSTTRIRRSAEFRGFF